MWNISTVTAFTSFALNVRVHLSGFNVSREFVDDHNAQEIVTRFSGLQISEAFRGSPNNLWLFLSEAGVREVDDKFGRGY